MKKLLTALVSASLLLSLCAGPVFAAPIPSELSGICSHEEWDVLKLVNKARLAEGLSPYSAFSALQGAADTREKELVEHYSHTRPNGSTCFTALTEGGLGYQSAGENIAAGQDSPQTVHQAWMGSDGHRANILDGRFTHMGVGYLADGFLGTSWVQMFISDACTVSAITLSSDAVTCLPGSDLDHLELYVQATCSVHGTTYLPLLSEMCSGYDANTQGIQTVTVRYAGQTAALQVNVTTTPLDTSGAENWAVDWLMKADTLGLLSQRNRTGFTANVTRLQFADLAVTLAEQLTDTVITPAAPATFTDTTEEVILKAKAAGIAGGYEVDGRFQFRPDNPISRQEICVMLAHVVDYVDAQRGAAAVLDRSQTMKHTFPDQEHIAGWALSQVTLMTNNDVMSGRASQAGTLLTPNANTTLQEAVTLTVKLHDILS